MKKHLEPLINNSTHTPPENIEEYFINSLTKFLSFKQGEEDQFHEFKKNNEDLSAAMIGLCSLAFSITKHPGFEDEREYRIVFFTRDKANSILKLTKEDKLNSIVKLTKGGKLNSIVKLTKGDKLNSTIELKDYYPHLEIPIQLSDIEHIIIGPSFYQKRNESCIKDILLYQLLDRENIAVRKANQEQIHNKRMEKQKKIQDELDKKIICSDIPWRAK